MKSLVERIRRNFTLGNLEDFLHSLLAGDLSFVSISQYLKAVGANELAELSVGHLFFFDVCV